MNSVTIGVPITDLPGAAIVPFTVSLKPGTGTKYLTNIVDVTEANKASIQRVIRACERLTHSALGSDGDLTIESEIRLPSLTCESWEMPLSCALASQMSRIPLRQNLAATGPFEDEHALTFGRIYEGLDEKIKAAVRAGIKTFLIPAYNSHQSMIKVEGMDIIPVKDFRQAWYYATRIPAWRAAR